MQDRQQFQKTVLPNGITLYTYQYPFSICCLEFILPVGAGHAHPINNFIPGSPHFLEHAQLIRSDKYPNAYQLDRLLGLKGGHSNGTTYPTTTHYELDVPASQLEFGVEALVDRTFNPIFKEEDLFPERSVVINERNQRKFYPGRNPVSKYYLTEFLDDAEYPLEQLFGSDKQLSQMDVPVLEEMHQKISLNQNLIAIAVGPSDFQDLARSLSHVPTQAQDFSLALKELTWKNKEYRQEYFETISQPTLEVAWIHPQLSYAEFRAVSLIISLLVNSTHGALHREFREEKGWTYGLDGYCQQRTFNTIHGLNFPVNTVEQIEYIRGCLIERIHSAIEDQDLVEAEISRYICNQVYNYQTAGDIISGASYDLATYNHIYTEMEWQKAVEAVADPVWRRHIVKKYFQEGDMGSMCFMPERRKKVAVRDIAS